MPVFEEETDKLIAEMEEKFLDGNEFDLCEPIIKLVSITSAITIFSLRNKFDIAQKMAEPIETLVKFSIATN